jgi:hypothetical protein
MLTLHTQVENLATLLHLRRSAATQRQNIDDAYVNLAASILNVTPMRIGQLVPARVQVAPVLVTSRSSRRAA